MAFDWNEDIEREVVRLRDEEHLLWREIAARLGMANGDVPRVRHWRLKSGRSRGGKQIGAGEGVPSGVPAEPMDYEVQAKFVQSDYEFDGERYYFAVNGQVVKIPKATWENIVAAYANAGGNEVQASIAMRFGMHKKVLEACLKLYGHFKARPPVTREALAEAERTGNHQPLYEKAIEVAEAQFQTKLDRFKLIELERQNRELLAERHHRDGQKQELLAAVQTLLYERGAGAGAPATVEKVQPAEGEDYELLVTLFDTHFGLRVFGSSGFLTDYTTDIAADYVRHVARAAAQYVTRYKGRCRRIRLVNGGDTFHAFERRTRRGTPLERDRDDKAVFNVALNALIDAIGILRQVTDVVEYDGMPGNHDGIHEWFLRQGLALYFREAQDVAVNTHEKKRTFFLLGTSLHVFDHGEEFVRFDPSRFTKAELIARMTGRPYTQAEKVYFYVGHTHHREVKEWGPHLSLRRCPTFAHTNDHEEELVFYGEPEVSFFRLDARGRVAGEETVFLTDLAAEMETVNIVGQ